LLFSSAIWVGASSTFLYQYGFHKYHASQATGIDENQLNEVAITITNYFTNKIETPQMKVTVHGEEFNLFHDYELTHLDDVKSLFQVAHRAQVASIAYIVAYALLFLLWRRESWRDLSRGIVKGSIVTLCFISIIAIISFFGFQQIFTTFHYLVFGDPSQSPWMLDPSKDYLIMLFPEPFWQNSALLGGISIAIGALLLGGIAWLSLQIHPGRDNNNYRTAKPTTF
jgi:integral membrane protein (TIGR01906 family)